MARNIALFDKLKNKVSINSEKFSYYSKNFRCNSVPDALGFAFG